MPWCLTPINNPDRHMEGPFESRDEAITRATYLLSNDAKWEALMSGRDPVRLVPTYCKGHTTETVIVYQPKQTVVHGGPTTGRATAKHRLSAASPISPTIYKLTEQQLRYFCRQLDIPIPDGVTSKAELIAIIEKDLG